MNHSCRNYDPLPTSWSHLWTHPDCGYDEWIARSLEALRSFLPPNVTSEKKDFFLLSNMQIGRTASEPLTQCSWLASCRNIHWNFFFLFSAYLSTLVCLYVCNGKNIGYCSWRRQEDVARRVCSNQSYTDLEQASRG